MRNAGFLVMVLALAGCGSSSSAVSTSSECPAIDAGPLDSGLEAQPSESGANDLPDVPDASANEAAAQTSPDGAGQPDVLDESNVLASDATPDSLAPVDAPPERSLTEPDAATGCHDNRKDGAETDIDCGGGSCPPCGLGQGCLADSDCGSWPGCNIQKGGCTCDAVSKKCVVDHCSDHHQNVGETTVDCGGGECTGCAVDQACVLDSDCATRACDALALVCRSSTCLDHHQDGAETDIDCGGGQCPGCATGARCNLPLDCQSRGCDGISNTCAADACSDHVLDGKETDVDCGGPDCAARCEPFRRCIDTSDCTSGHTCTTTIPHVCN